MTRPVAWTLGVATLLAVSVGVTVFVVDALRERRVRTVPDDIASDCSRPVDAEVNSFLATVPDGFTVRFQKGACYGIDGSIQVWGRNNMVFDGRGATFRTLTAGDANRYNWDVEGGSNITIRNMTVVGAHSPIDDSNYESAYTSGWEWQHGFVFGGTDGGLLEDVVARDVIGDFVEIQLDRRPGAAAWVPSRNITVRNLRGEGAGRHGAAITNGENIVIEKSHFQWVGYWGIDVELDSGEELGRNITIRDNRFDRVRWGVIANGGSGATPNVGNITIAGNVQLSEPTICSPAVDLAAPPGTRRSSYRITNNHFRTMADAIAIARTDDVEIRDNVVDFYSVATCVGPPPDVLAGVRLLDANNVRIENNRFHGAEVVTQSV